MGVHTDHPGDGAAALLDAVATAVIDGGGTVLRWSQTAARLLERTAEEVRGRPVHALLATGGETGGDEAHSGEAAGAAPCASRVPRGGRALLSRGSGGTVDVTYRVLPLDGSTELLVAALPTDRLTEWQQGASLVRALLAQDVIGLGLHDTDLRTVRTNFDTATFGRRARSPAVGPADLMGAQDIEAILRQVLETGVPVLGKERRLRSPQLRGRERTLSLSAFRLEDAGGVPTGVASAFIDVTAQARARRQLDLVLEAATRIGGELDVTRAAQELADVLVPFADLAAVAVADAVLEGDEPPVVVDRRRHPLRLVASAASTGNPPPGFLGLGGIVPPFPEYPEQHLIQRGQAVVADRAWALTVFGGAGVADQLVPPGGHSLAAAPMFARGLLLGAVLAWRTERPEPFDSADAELLRELATRAALSLDNARRYTRERRTAIALQQSLLPPAMADTPAAETAGIYLPAGGAVGGDWFDVIPLPSLRVALVVGDVEGHGLHAAATMGRLRTAIQTLADLELDPKELLTHIEDLVQRLSGETGPGVQDITGSELLYAVYDPVSGCCTFAGAGHPPPVVLRPDGTAEVIEMSLGPPLGVGDTPFEAATLQLEPGSVLAMYTDGLLKAEDRSADEAVRWLRDTLAEHGPRWPLGDIRRELLVGLNERRHHDDIALLLARTRVVPPESVAAWEFPADPAAVADARDVAARQLTAWGLEDLVFTTELVVSELVTNAIRYAGGPVGLRLIREGVLVCEVTDPSNTQPRLRRAETTDEGGRGLFLVAQLTTRWGSRYGLRGKTIWAEQPLGPALG
ncbi:SpoIIE family protein phosphatase [Streptomyces sp. P1-3]|uniref:SpoIIE family protein phosphatase n=1 Tax=Streptomyces sp. P1-3 TaxID=3421658 RepID=UPI003D35EF42